MCQPLLALWDAGRSFGVVPLRQATFTASWVVCNLINELRVGPLEIEGPVLLMLDVEDDRHGCDLWIVTHGVLFLV
jgi:hypothetical protein